jgi:hypothetical protein
MGEVQYHIGETLDEALKGETEQSFDPREFGYDEVGFVDSVELSVAEDDDSDTGKTYMLAATCSEDLRFHRGQYPELFEPFEDEDEEPELTQEAMNAVEAVFSEQYSGIDIYGCSDGYLRFEVAVFEGRGDFPIDALDEGTLWPIIAQIANESDPGTFGSEYIWNTVAKLARDLKEDAE